MESFDLIKNFNIDSEVTDIKEKVFQGVESADIKEVIIKIQVDLQDTEREKYIYEYFRIQPSFIATTAILKRVALTFSIKINGEKVPHKKFYNHIVLRKMEISDTNDNFVTILKDHESDDGKIILATFQEGRVRRDKCHHFRIMNP